MDADPTGATWELDITEDWININGMAVPVNGQTSRRIPTRKIKSTTGVMHGGAHAVIFGELLDRIYLAFRARLQWVGMWKLLTDFCGCRYVHGNFDEPNLEIRILGVCSTYVNGVIWI